MHCYALDNAIQKTEDAQFIVDLLFGRHLLCNLAPSGRGEATPTKWWQAACSIHHK